MGSAHFAHFAHLHCHSAYSLLEGTATPQALVSAAKKLGMPALALTDRNNLYGAVHFYVHALKAGVKPVIGMEVDLDDGSSLVLLARNMDGYRNLCHLATTLCRGTDPEAFQPAGFDEDDEWLVASGEWLVSADDHSPLTPNSSPLPLPWEPGVWGVPVFAFTDKPRPLSMARNVKPARLPREVLLSGRHARGLIALSGGRRGLVNSLVARGKMRQASRAAGMLLSAFGEGNFFIELTALDDADLATLPKLAELAGDLGIPIVAANDVLYAEAAGARTARVLAAIRDRRPSGAGTGDRAPGIRSAGGPVPASEEVGTERYLKTAEQMGELFSRYPQAIANAGFIAEQCNLELPLHKPLFPSVDLRRGETPYSRLWKLCFAGATRHYRPLTEPVISRLGYELEVIEKLGFSPYFLVVYDIVRFAHSRDIPILARGSAADSLVAYVLDITQVDPLAHNLLFERFLNPSRAEFELPDIDLDLCWRRRDEVLHYVYERYGRDHVATVGTHITFRLRSAWREVAKALGIAPERISYVASRLPHLVSAEDLFEDEQGSEVRDQGSGSQADPTPDPRPPLADAHTPGKVPKLRNEEEQEAFELCKAIEGLPRHMGMHCAGVVISPGSLPLADLVPLARAARDPDMAITQYEKDAIESLGLVKMDLLGSRALTTLVDTVQSVVASGQWPVVSGQEAQVDTDHRPLATGHSSGLEAIPFDDERTYKMMTEGETLGCFQLESPGMRALLKWLRPRSLNDVTASISLFRPGPLEGGFMEAFMRRRLGLEPVSYPHPAMEPILKDTYGVILYQEQFLRLAHDLAGLDLGEAEKLRKELGKSHTPEERARLGSAFVAGAIERGIDQMQAEKVWEIIAGYTGFGFCQAHACSYAVTAYRGAYMKAHYPAQFLAAQLNNQGGYYGPSVYVEDARRLRIKLLPPHVNESGAWCEAGAGGRGAGVGPIPDPTPDPRSIRIGLQFVQGLSRQAIAALLTERQSGGPFRSLVDLMERVEMTLPEVMALVKVGACDGLGREGSRGEPERNQPLALSEISLQPLSEAKGNGDDLAPTPHLPHIEPLRGSLGEPVGAFHRPGTRVAGVNRRQLLWLLPQIVSVLGASERLATRRRRSRREVVGFDLFSQATGSDGPGAQGAPGVQVMMGDFGDYGRNPRVLGKRVSRIDVPNMDDYSRAEKLRLEQEVLGFALSGNEMELYQEALNEQGVLSALRLSTGPFGAVQSPKHALERSEGSKVQSRDQDDFGLWTLDFGLNSALVSVAGTMVAGRRHLTKSGEWMLFMTLQDLSGLIEVVLFPEAFRKNAKVVANGGYGPYLVRGQLQASGTGRGIGIQPPSDLRAAEMVSIKMHPVVIADEVALLDRGHFAGSGRIGPPAEHQP